MEPEALKAVLAQYIACKERYSKGTVDPYQQTQSGLVVGILFVEELNSLSAEFARIVGADYDLRHKLELWEALAELAANHLNNMRAVRQK